MNNSYLYQNFIIEILYEDNDIAILNKPSGLLTHKKNLSDSSPSLAESLKMNFNIKDDEVLKEGIVHRLDVDTRGRFSASSIPSVLVLMACVGPPVSAPGLGSKVSMCDMPPDM